MDGRFVMAFWRIANRLRIHARPMSLGVRGILLDGQGRLLLVRHTYMPGWHLPGGGVDPGETAPEAMTREMREEANVTLLEPPRPLSLHFNRHMANRDHVMMFVCGAYRRDETPSRNIEIAETGFFALDALPEGVTKGTRRRIAEYRDGIAPDDNW